MIISHEHYKYIRRRSLAGDNKFNGAYYYSKEIVKNIIPNVETNRNWITINVYGEAFDHSIVFVHNNLHPENYQWYMRYRDMVLVCGVPETVDKVSHYGKSIYVPLSIDVDYVKQFRTDHKSGSAFVGRKAKRHMAGTFLPEGIDCLEGLPREELLRRMAKYETIYAVGRTAIEAKCLGCRIGIYDERFKDANVWQVIDNKEAAKILQEKLNDIDRI